MARWRLVNAHYLNVPGTEWEYKEQDRTSGKQARKVFAVPAFLDPRDAADHNYPGEIVVCHEGKGQGRDITFLGEPTPEMEPMDDEAEAISKSCSHKWVHPIESLPGQGYSQSLLSSLEAMLAAKVAGEPKAVANQSVDPNEFAAMKEQLATLMAQNAELLAAQAAKPGRRA